MYVVDHGAARAYVEAAKSYEKSGSQFNLMEAAGAYEDAYKAYNMVQQTGTPSFSLSLFISLLITPPMTSGLHLVTILAPNL